MAKFRWYACPDCGGKFRHLHHPDDSPPPNRCSLCGNWMDEDEPPTAVFVAMAPGIRKSAYAQSVNVTYRAMEDASIQRAKDAADMAGISEWETNHLKITNMRDPSEMREGDTAAIMPAASEAARRLTVGPSAPGFQQLEGGAPNYAPGVGGNEQRDAMVASIRTNHTVVSSQIIAKGNMGTYKE